MSEHRPIAPAGPRTILLLASDTAVSDAIGQVLRAFPTGPVRLLLGFLTGPSAALGEGIEAHRMTVTAAPGRLRRLALRLVRKSRGPASHMRLATRYDPWLRTAASQSDLVIALDGEADSALDAVSDLGPSVRAVPSHVAVETLEDESAWAGLYAALTPPADGASTRNLSSEQRITNAETTLRMRLDVPYSRGAEVDTAAVYTFFDRLLRAGQQPALLALIPFVAQLPGLSSAHPLLEAYRTVSTLTVDGAADADISTIAGQCLAAADAALARDDLERAISHVSLALRLLFHRELHSDTADSPLVQNPTGFLAPLRDSRVWELLTRPVPAGHHAAGPPAGGQSTQVLVLAGAYGRFHEPLVEALDKPLPVDVATVHPGELHRSLTSMEIDPDLIRFRLERSLGLLTSGYRPAARALKGRDLVVADWAGKGAVLASLLAPPATRLVVRVHSVDALRAWVHLIDWSRVEELVCVSAHIRDLVGELLGARLAGTRRRVLPNLVDPARFRPVPREPAHRTLGIVGWAQRVKDPLWAVEVLAQLAQDGGEWRLRLIGPGFQESGPASGRAYAAAFRRRAAEPDVRDRIDYVGFTEDVPEELRQVDFIVSSSIRESFPVGLLEGALTGAIPVVRDWPQFAKRRAASRIYPADWVVDTPGQAAARIRAAADPAAFATQSARATAVARELVQPERVAATYRGLALGDLGRLFDLTRAGDDEAATALVHELLASGTADLGTLRQAATSTHTAGEMTLRREVLEQQAARFPSVATQRLVRRQIGRLRETSPDWAPSIHRHLAPVAPLPGKIVHVLKVSAPHRQSGYSVRSLAILTGQHAHGLTPVGVTALDFPDTAGSDGTPPEVETVAGIRHRRLLRSDVPAGEPYDLYLDGWATALADVVQEERPAVIHVHSGHRGYEAALVALAVGKAVDIPVVYEVRGFFEAMWTADLDRAERGETYERRRATELRCMRAAAAVVTLGEAMREEIIARGVPPERVHVVPNGVDIAGIQPRARSATLTAELGLEGRFVFGYISSLDHYREGHELLIEAAALLNRAEVPAAALIVGDGRRAQELHEYARSLGALDVVRFTGRVEHAEIAEYYAQCDVFVVPRVDERAARLVTPLKPFEAMAAGVPLAVSDLPALLEITGGGDRGAAFRAGDVRSLVDTLMGLRSDPERAAAMAGRAREWVRSERSWESNAVRYRPIYDSVLRGTRG